MRHRWGWAIAVLAFCIGVGVAYFAAGERSLSSGSTPRVNPSTPAVQETAPLPPAAMSYEEHVLAKSVAHILTIPPDAQWEIRPRTASSLQPLTVFVAESGAIAAINGGYFDPVNQQSTSIIIESGAVTADPQNNDRLMDNPDLTPYLPKILNRSEFRRYRCRDRWHYAIAFRADPVPPACELIDALGAGPRLLPQDTAIQEGFVDMVDGVIVRDAIGMFSPNARSAVGMTATGDVIWLMVAQRPEHPEPTGMSLIEVADFLRSLGVVEALNLDGGSSSALVYNDLKRYGNGNESADERDRPIKSALTVQFVKP